MSIVATPFNRASEIALSIYESVLGEVRADRLVNAAVERVGDLLFVQGRHIDLSKFERVWIAGAGKASVPMASALAELIGERLTGGLVVTKTGLNRPVSGIDVIEGAHPIPDESSITAGRRMFEFARGLSETDLVLFVLSGGSSALMESPAEGFSLSDLQKMNAKLLASGKPIGDVNKVRSAFSQIKAGGLARAFNPATVIALVLSDVVGNDLRAIGSGPLLSNVGVDEENPIEHFVIGSISLAVHLAADAAKRLGVDALPFADPLKGEARVMGRKICRYASTHERQNSCLIFGGETTVVVRGSGRGGRCQEMAAAAAPYLAKMPDCCFLAAGTDGNDGPTDAAGGLVDPGSMVRASQKGQNQRRALASNDSFAFLEACGGLIKTGPTDSNVNDIVLFVTAGL